MAVHWHLTFFTARSSLLLYSFVRASYNWQKNLIISNDIPLKPPCQCCSNFMWNLLGAGEWKIPQMGVVHWSKCLPCPYTCMVKTFKNSSPEPNKPGPYSYHKLWGVGDLLKLLKWWSYVDVRHFYGKVKFASQCICIGHNIMHLYWKFWGDL